MRANLAAVQSRSVSSTVLSCSRENNGKKEQVIRFEVTRRAVVRCNKSFTAGPKFSSSLLTPEESHESNIFTLLLTCMCDVDITEWVYGLV